MDLSDPILSRFDLICVLRDIVSQGGTQRGGARRASRERALRKTALWRSAERFSSVLALQPDADDDFSLGDYVLTNHQLHHPGLGNLEQPQKRARELEARLQAGEPHEPINQETLQKYILYARCASVERGWPSEGRKGQTNQTHLQTVPKFAAE